MHRQVINLNDILYQILLEEKERRGGAISFPALITEIVVDHFKTEYEARLKAHKEGQKKSD